MPLPLTTTGPRSKARSANRPGGRLVACMLIAPPPAAEDEYVLAAPLVQAVLSMSTATPVTAAGTAHAGVERMKTSFPVGGQARKCWKKGVTSPLRTR